MFVPGFSKAAVITPSDTTNNAYGLTQKAIYVGGAGDVSVIPSTGVAAVVFKAVPVGTILPVQAKRVNASGTTATLLIALGD